MSWRIYSCAAVLSVATAATAWAVFRLKRQRFPVFRRLSEVCDQVALQKLKGEATTADQADTRVKGGDSPVYAITGATGLIGSKLVETLLSLWAGELVSTPTSDPLLKIASDLPTGTLRLLIRPSARNQFKLKQWRERWPQAQIEAVWGVGENLYACQAFINTQITVLFHIAAAGGDW